MKRLVDLLKEFHAAVRAFGQKGWLKRAFTMQTTSRSWDSSTSASSSSSTSSVTATGWRSTSQLMERTYRIERSVAALVAQRRAATGESEEAAAAALGGRRRDHVGRGRRARAADGDRGRDAREFRLEVKESLAQVGQEDNKMLDAVHNQIAKARTEVSHREHGRVLADK